ncbi:hypothetical protein QGX15_gp109 [Pseudomonas phage psageK4e]|uniref:Uncharacterized protein n=1 Tax=Pseudomonas phage psageK4e TaxID=2875723 RepID=A0AAE8XN91_9CAUD|nr:hypothetical protein QGX15_gp109 [Pseudomonas phage psageK4e]UAW53586.1 hypothetical protein psageK4e_138 [Pseudomonas phage psageK4e]
MAWFERKAKPERKYVMFDLDKVKEANHLSPIQILELVCSAFQISPESAVLMNADPDKYKDQYPNIAHLLRVHKV